MSLAIWWIRRDLRLADNPALNAALSAREKVLPVFVLDEALLRSPYVGEKRLAFLYANLRALDAELRRRGSALVLRRGDPLGELQRLMAESGADVLFAEADYSPYARRRDQRVEQALPVHWVGSPSFRPAGSVLKADGQPYTVFTPFAKAWRSLPGLEVTTPLPAPQSVPSPAGVFSLSLPETPRHTLEQSFPAGEAEARRRLEVFLREKIYDYAEARDRQDLDGTSALSPYLRFGLLSARQAVSAALQAQHQAPSVAARRSAELWLNELIWREFYIHILYHFPRLRRESFRPLQVRWLNDPSSFERWKAGESGYPIVDAAMRQLSATGWMHNRGRMIVASFLTKDLLMDWRWGERWFMEHLLDGDPAANNGGWQWTAGVGTDAAPYFRLFNPVAQAQKSDPQGEFVRRWLPELRHVPQEYLHTPWKMPPEVQRRAACRIGKEYPPPLVDHAQARLRALAAFAPTKRVS